MSSTSQSGIKRMKRIPRRRSKPRRRRPDLFYQPPKEQTWEEISFRLRVKWWREATSRNEYPKCVICGEVINQFRQMVPDHREPGKMGGCKDHSESNLGPAHVICNNLKGSKRNYTQTDCLRDLGLL